MTTPAKTVFFMDIARNAGWCEGQVGGKPIFGSVRLAPDGSDSPAVAAGLFRFIGQRFQAFKPNVFVYEAPRTPMQMQGRTNASTLRLTLGLPMVAEAAAYLCGCWDIREAEAATIRAFVYPKSMRPSGKMDTGQLKRAVFQQIKTLGYDVADTDQSDAVAGWLYACSILDARVGIRTAPLFGGAS